MRWLGAGLYHTERRPDRSADKEDTYGGYNMHFSLCAPPFQLQKGIPMLQIGFNSALRLYLYGNCGSPVSKQRWKPGRFALRE